MYGPYRILIGNTFTEKIARKTARIEYRVFPTLISMLQIKHDKGIRVVRPYGT